MTILIDLLLVTLIIVYIIDISGAIEDLAEPLLAKLFHKSKVRLKKPWSCSKCMTFWIGLIYLLITMNFTIPYIFYVCMLSMLTPFFNNVLTLLLEALIKLTDI